MFISDSARKCKPRTTKGENLDWDISLACGEYCFVTNKKSPHLNIHKLLVKTSTNFFETFELVAEAWDTILKYIHQFMHLILFPIFILHVSH